MSADLFHAAAGATVDSVMLYAGCEVPTRIAPGLKSEVVMAFRLGLMAAALADNACDAMDECNARVTDRRDAVVLLASVGKMLERAMETEGAALDADLIRVIIQAMRST